jgi:predicted RND superfamily exporter protein
MSNPVRRVGELVTTYSKTTILVVFVLTALFAVGIPMVEQESDTGQFESESPAINASDFIDQNFVTGGGGNTTVQVVQRGGADGNALSRASLVESLELQQAMRDSPVVGPTLAAGGSTTGIANVLTDAAFTQRPPDQRPATVTLEDRIALLEDISDEELDTLVETVLGEGGNEEAIRLLPTSYDPGSRTANASLIVAVQPGGTVGIDLVTEAQLEIRDLAAQEESEYSVFGSGIITHEIEQSLGDSFAIVGPLALLFVVLALTIAYRDLLDILLGVLGIVAVLVWTFGFMGWADIAFNQLLISVPVLLIGLSIDYAIHVFMRHREQRLEEDEARDLRLSMAIAVGGVGVALVWVTATAALGFLANLTSPIGPLRDFGTTSAFGVLAALVVFGALVPAMKVELDGLLEARGWDRTKPAFGTGDSRLSGLLGTGATAARRFPVAVVVLTLLLTLGGIYGATQVDTNFEQEDFLADSPPGWTEFLPGSLEPGTYQAKSDLEFVQANFQQGTNQGELLIRGDITDDEALRWMAAAREDLADRDTTFEFADGTAEVTTPLSVMQETAAENPDSQFAQQFEAVAGEDGVPESNVEQLYRSLLATEFAAGANVAPTERMLRERLGQSTDDADDEFEALRITVDIRGDATSREAAADLRAAADALEAESDGQLDVVATGNPVVFDDIESDLFSTVIQSLLVTLVSVFLFLTVAYRVTGNPASLGVVTLLPVLFSVAWILGSMWLLGISFNILTGTITSLTIGLGIAYSIHISSRYELELRRQGDVWAALQTTVTGTGGALLGSAATTVGAFGTLSVAILPVLEQFGIITGLTIIYAFLASVLVLPSMLVLWTRYLGPSGHFPDSDTAPAGAVAADGSDTDDGNDADGDQSEGNGNQSEGNGDRSEGNGDQSKGNGDRSEGNGDQSEGNGDQSEGNGEDDRKDDEPGRP